jgi:hypothetical protein
MGLMGFKDFFCRIAVKKSLNPINPLIRIKNRLCQIVTKKNTF